MINRTVLNAVLCLGLCNVAVFAQAPLCNDSMIMALEAKWIYRPAPRIPGLSNEQYLQTKRRADAVHPLLLEAYPEPVGMQEGKWGHAYGTESLGGGPHEAWLIGYYYRAGLIEYVCAPNASPDSIFGKLGAPFKPVYSSGDYMTNLSVHFNRFEGLLQPAEMKVGEFQVFHRPRRTGVWKGYDLYASGSGQMVSKVMLTRKGTPLFRPVTRKQYLDSMIATFQRQYDDTIVAAKEILKNPDAARVPEFVEGAKRSLADAARVRDDFSAPFHEALKKHAADGTLGSPAIVDPSADRADVFTTEEKGGQTLVTVNPDYFRKDLPAYVPQFMVLMWKWRLGVASVNFRTLVEANFPIEKLQAMIDK